MHVRKGKGDVLDQAVSDAEAIAARDGAFVDGLTIVLKVLKMLSDFGMNDARAPPRVAAASERTAAESGRPFARFAWRLREMMLRGLRSGRIDGHVRILVAVQGRCNGRWGRVLGRLFLRHCFFALVD